MSFAPFFGGFGSGGAAGGAFPVREDVDGSFTNSPSTSHTVGMFVTSGGPVSGELLVDWFFYEGTFASTWPGSWSLIRRVDWGTSARLECRAKVSDGTETNFTVTTSSATRTSNLSWRVSNVPLGLAGIECSTGTTASDPDAITPSWGAKKTKFVGVQSGTFNGLITTWPLADNRNLIHATSNRIVAACSEDNDVATTFDPGAFIPLPAGFDIYMTTALRGS